MKSKTESKSKFLIVSLLLLLLSPVVYVLSIGPAVWLQMNGYLSEPVENFLEAFYFPLAWLTKNSEAFGAIIRAYLNWFFS